MVCDKNIIHRYNLEVFDNIKNPTFDEFSLHGGCDIIKGQKYAANKVWILFLSY